MVGGVAHTAPRLAVRAVILLDGCLLLVNAYPGTRSDLWCAPGGGVNPGTSLPENLIREVHEETGLTVSVGSPCLINEFHDPSRGFHQVEVFFRCVVTAGLLSPGWRDPERIVNRHLLATPTTIAALRVKPDSLAAVAWGDGLLYDPLEVVVR